MKNFFTYKQLRIFYLTVSLAIVGAMTSVSPVAAQEGVQLVRTLVIDNNQVLIDGNRVSDEAVPDGVNLEGISISYSFVGIDVPVVTIDNRLFAIEQDRLKPIESREASRLPAAERDLRARAARQANGWIVDSDRGEYYTFQGERLEASDAVPRILKEANTLYLDDLQKQNQRLFLRLTREQELESEAEYLAVAARRASNPEERSRHVEALTSKLNEIFDLKQQNRRDEIAQFEADLDELRRRVEKREELRDDIIEQRVIRLAGPGN